MPKPLNEVESDPGLKSLNKTVPSFVPSVLHNSHPLPLLYPPLKYR